MGLPALSFSPGPDFSRPEARPRTSSASSTQQADPAVRSRLVDLGYDIFPRERQTPEALGALVKADAEKWWPLVKEFNIKVE
jgi:hypothetical protein